MHAARTNEQVARLTLLAAAEELTIQALDYCLKQLGYRFNVASLNNALLNSRSILWTGSGYFHPPARRPSSSSAPVSSRATTTPS